LTIQVETKADSGAHAELAEKVLVRRAALQNGVEGPAVQYMGAVATYRVHLSNPGNAPARNVKLAATLPGGAKYVSSTEGGRSTPNGNQVIWNLDNLEPGVERTFLVRCNLGLAGNSRLEVSSSAEDELVASAEAVTRVESIAELRLDVKEPEGPVAVGEEAIYELCIHNHGTKIAQDIDVMGYFSQGIEPTVVEGGAYRVGPGQVIFNTIPSLPAGEEITLKIRARAEAPGNHVFRAEVHCKPLGTRLVSEETTHFYQDGPAAQQSPREAVAAENAMPERTADRRLPGVPSQSDPARQNGPIPGSSMR